MRGELGEADGEQTYLRLADGRGWARTLVRDFALQLLLILAW